MGTQRVEIKELLPAQQPDPGRGRHYYREHRYVTKKLLNTDMYLNTKIMQMSIQISRTEM
jgi:hypothetical protein